ncbi:MAG: RluA family pseudouridine synthase [Tissierellia bacterium]|nr:RluA family pseudouridine synthase [Tissierellia bacterium]
MRELIIDKNESGQRLDRFLRKYLDEAPYGFIQKMIRKKNIKLNGKKAKGDTIIIEGDIVQLYLADEIIEKFRGDRKIVKTKYTLNIIYEDENIILINKPIDILSHAAEDLDENLVDAMIYYLYEKGEYNPELEKTFTPAICNRLDRNTSGIIIGAKNSLALRVINSAMKKNQINRYYKTIVKGTIKEDKIVEGYLIKDRELNKVEVLKEEVDGSKEILTKIKVLDFTNKYSLLEIQLITGRTHQIRAHLSSIGYPIIGDIKYGNRAINKYFKENFGLDNQILHAYKIGFEKLDKPLDYLNHREFIANPNTKYRTIEEKLFNI